MNAARTLPHLALVTAPPPAPAPANEVTPPSVRGAEATSVTQVTQATQAGSRPIIPRFLFGDSTPFPHDCDFVDLVHHAVSSGVALMKAHHAMSRATSRTVSAERARREERTMLLHLAEAVKRAVGAETAAGSEIARRTAGRTLAVTRAVVETELAALEAEAQRTLVAATSMVEDARASATRAVEELARAHDVPGTEVALRLVAKDGAYDAVAVAATPYGVEAAFGVAIPAGHAWSELRRVCDLEDFVDVHVPRDAGWFSKRVELTRVKLGKLFVREVAVDPSRCSVLLSKSTKGPGGFRVELDPRNAMRVRWSEVPELEGGAAPLPYELSEGDAANVLRLWRTIARSARDLSSRRAEMIRALFDGKPLSAADPLAICDRLVRALAPTTREIALRAGAPGELVLRRDAGTRRRDEIYITKAELWERIETLPPALRRVFDPLDLDGATRSPRAPAPSLSSFLEISDDDIVED